MSLLVEIVVAYVVVAVLCALFLWTLCVAASRGDDQAEEALRRERQERKARSDLYGNGGGFRGR
jgi:type II secretory pathway pseudopilin PulG